MIPIYRDPPAGTKNPSPADRLEVVYNGYVMNSAASPAEDMIELVDTAVVPITDQVIENKQGRDGMEVYQAYKSGLSIRLRGFIKKPTLNALMDEATLMSEKFDAALLSRRFQTSTIGFQPLAFNVPTADGVNYPGNLVPSFYLARTMEPITFGRTKYDGYAMPFRIDMLARDPSRFFSTKQSVVLPALVDNTLGRYPSWPTYEVTMTGPGNEFHAIQNQHAFPSFGTLLLDLRTLVNGDRVRVDFEHRRVYLNDVLAMRLYNGGTYWQIEPRLTSNIYVSNNLNGVNGVLSWYRAFPT